MTMLSRLNRDLTMADTARAPSGGRVLVAFQPHLYSRTRHLARELGVALAAADAVCVTDNVAEFKRETFTTSRLLD